MSEFKRTPCKTDLASTDKKALRPRTKNIYGILVVAFIDAAGQKTDVKNIQYIHIIVRLILIYCIYSIINKQIIHE